MKKQTTITLFITALTIASFHATAGVGGMMKPPAAQNQPLSISITTNKVQ